MAGKEAPACGGPGFFFFIGKKVVLWHKVSTGAGGRKGWRGFDRDPDSQAMLIERGSLQVKTRRKRAFGSHEVTYE